jgi:hypothetical protein
MLKKMMKRLRSLWASGPTTQAEDAMIDGADMTDRERRIRDRAERIWEDAGKPVGQDDDIWGQAEREIEAEDNLPPPRAA